MAARTTRIYIYIRIIYRAGGPDSRRRRRSTYIKCSVCTNVIFNIISRRVLKKKKKERLEIGIYIYIVECVRMRSTIMFLSDGCVRPCASVCARVCVSYIRTNTHA